MAMVWVRIRFSDSRRVRRSSRMRRRIPATLMAMMRSPTARSPSAMNGAAAARMGAVLAHVTCPAPVGVPSMCRGP